MIPRIGRPKDPVGRILHSVDWVLVVITTALITMALLNLNSAGAGDWTGRVATQLRWVGLGFGVLCVVAALDHKVIYRGAYAAYAVGVGLLFAVALFGVKVNEARRWLGSADVRFQPSEVMKVALIAGMARYLHDLPRGQKRGFRHLAVPFAIVVAPVALIVQQPDLSTGIMLLLIAFSMIAAAELRVRSMVALLAAGILTFALGWSSMASYQRRRVDVWLNPELYAEDEGYQTIQSMISVGNGGFFGRGISKGTQNVLGFLPERHTDFPFAVFAEEWGFAGTSLLLALYTALILWALNLGTQARDRFGAMLCAGVAALFFWHVVINVGMVLQLLPVTGVTLPFVSFGGSNVLSMMIALGLLMSVSRSRMRR